MTRSQFRLLMVLTVVSGFLGGAVSSLVLRGAPALAQEGAQALQEVRAERFVLVDQQGRERVSLDLMAGEPSLSLQDEAGKVRASLELVAGSPSLTFWDEAGEMRTSLGLWAGEPSLDLLDEAGRTRARLELVTGEPSLSLFDAAEQIRVALGSTKTEGVGAGGTEKYPISTITLFGETGPVLWQAP